MTDTDDTLSRQDLLHQGKAVQTEDDALITWLRHRTHVLHAALRQRQTEVDDLRKQLKQHQDKE